MQDNIDHTASVIADTDNTIHQQAKAEERHRQAVRRATQLRNDPVLSGINKLAFSVAPKYCSLKPEQIFHWPKEYQNEQMSMPIRHLSNPCSLRAAIYANCIM